jgi:hypothetical protein
LLGTQYHVLGKENIYPCKIRRKTAGTTRVTHEILSSAPTDAG